MSKASESALGALHGVLAKVLHEQVTRTEDEEVFDEEGAVVKTGNVIYTATPATLAIAAKFLKDNDITVDVEVNTSMSGIRAELAKKQKQSRLSDATKEAGDGFH